MFEPARIHHTALKSWQEETANLLIEPEELIRALNLPESLLAPIKAAHALFPLRIPRPFLARMAQGDISDPLLRQVMPLGIEQESTEGFVNDPLGEADSNPLPGIIHKYFGRVLLIAASQCAVNCRYCFRRHFDYQQNTPSHEDWLQAIGYISHHQNIEEAILSGGDPLAASDKKVEWLFEQLGQIPHLTRIRLHTRLPIVIPSRITDKLVNIFSASNKDVVMVIHCNHPQEIDVHVQRMLVQLKNAGVTLLNQSVLLKSVNDNSKTLADLSKRLFSCGVLPYYLHLLDRVSGTAHFEVPETHAKALYRELLNQLPGYLVPRLVREEAGAGSKTPVV